MHKVFSDPVLITAQTGGTRSGATVEVEFVKCGLLSRRVALAFLRNRVYCVPQFRPHERL